MWTIVGRKSSFKDDFTPISLNLAFRMPNARSTHMRVDECLWLNHTSSFVSAMLMGPIL